MGSYDIQKMQKKLQKYLDPDRFHHTIGVMHTSACLAMAFGYDLNDAQCAGLLHDSAKCIPNKKKLRICAENDIPLTDFEKAHPFLIHAKLGAYLAKERYGVEDPAILSAITWHTTGKPDMSLLDKIVYVADYIEPMRCKSPDLPEIRRMAFRDLDETMYLILKSTLDFLGEDPSNTDPTSLRAYDFYRTLHFAGKYA